MKRALALSALLLATPALAQDEDQGFFGRLFGGGDEETEDGGGFLEGLIEDNLSGEGRDVEVTGFQGALSGRAQLETMTFADPDGVWLTLNDVVLDWNRSALLRGRLEVNELTAGEILVPRLPLPAESEAPAPEASGFSLPELPVSVNIGRIEAARVLLGEPLIGEEIEASVAGSLSLADGEGTADLDIIRTNGEGQLVLDAAYANDTNVLALDLNVTEGPDGIIARLIDLPGRPDLTFEISGEAPVDAYAADIRLATAGEDRLTGRITTGTPEGAEEGTLEIVADLSGDIAPIFAPDYQPFFGPDVALATRITTFPDGRLTLDDLAITARALTLEGRAAIGADGLPDLIQLDGQVSTNDGQPVLLPLSGPETTVESVVLDVSFDAERGETWTGQFEIARLARPGFSAESLAVTGEGQIVPGDAPQVSAVLDFEATRLDLGDPDASEALGERVTGGLQIDWTGGGPIRLTDLAIDGESYGLSGAADIAFGDNGPAIDGTAEVRADQLSVFSGIAQRTLGGSAALQTEFSAQPLAGFFDISAEGRTEDLIVSQEQADRILAGEARLALTAARDENGLRVNLETLESPNASVTGQATLRTGASTASISANLADAALVLPSVSGPVRLTASAEEADGLWNWTVDTGLEGTSLQATGTAADLMGTPVIAASGTLSSEDLSDFAELAQRPLSGSIETGFSGTVVADLSRADISLDGTGTDITVGQEQADALLEGPVRFLIDAALAGEVYSLTRGEITGEGLDLDASGILSPESSTVAATGRIADASRLLAGAPATPISFDLEADQDGRDWTFDVAANGPDFSLDTEGVALDPMGDLVVEGRLNANANDLSIFSDLANRTLAGRIDLEAEGRVSADLNRLDVTATANGQGLEVGFPQLNDVLSAPFSARVVAERESGPIDFNVTASSPNFDITAEGTAEDPMGTPRVDAVISASSDNLAIFSDLAGRPLAGSLTLDAEGNIVADLSAFDVAATASGSGLSVGIPQADQLLAGDLNAEVNASRAGDAIDIETLTLTTNLLNVSASGALGNGGSAIDLDARLANIAPFVSGFSGPLTVTGTVGQQSDQRYTVDIAADGPGGTRATVQGTTAPDFATVDLAVNGNAPLGLANQFIQPRSLAGTVAFDVTVNGPPALESVSGTVTSASARLVAPELGIILNDLAIDTQLSGGTAQLGVNAAVQDGGRISVTGPLTLTGSQNANLAIALQDVVLTDPQLYRTEVNGTVTVNGPLAGGAAIGGDLRLGETNIRIPSSGVGGGGDVPEIIHLNERPPVRATRARAGLLDRGNGNGDEARGPGFPLNISISAPNRIFIRGRGLDSEFGGSLRITGNTNDVIPIGAFNLIRGRLDILGQRLAIEEATATLQGSFVPVVRIRATTQTDEYNIGVIVSGRVENPEISFVSEPDLPEEEVLARLLFGRGLDTLSPLQAARLALAVRTLAGQGGESTLDRVRDGVGLADFDVTTDENGDAAVRAGAYLGENLYTDVTVNSGGETELNLNLDVSRSVTLKGGVTTEGDTSIGIFYERDY